MDYLFIDYCLETANLDSAMIKSAISAYELEQKPMVNSWIQNVVDAFTKWIDLEDPNSYFHILFKN